MTDAKLPPGPRQAVTTRRGLALWAGLGTASAVLPGCSAPLRGPAVPRGRVTSASVLGLPNERFHPFSDMPALSREFVAAGARRRRYLGLSETAPMPQVELLAISGGGENGAFGAGLLCGWTEHGGRPEFDLVTGVSTGALSAPFAYLGSRYDPLLRSVYTDITLRDVLVQRYMTAAIFDDGMADTGPLFRLISRYVDEALLVAIAQEYEKGRLLLVGSTDLDAQVPVIWNVGAMAGSGHPRALETIRRILLASASIPGAFPPVMIDVTADGRPYQEMHVDGGAFAQAFLYPAAVTAGRRERARRGQVVVPARTWVLRNSRIDAEWSLVERRTMGIASRAVATMIATSGLNDIVRLYNTSLRDGVDFNLAFIGPDFTTEYREPFEQSYMRALFDYGYQRAIRGYDWSKSPAF